MDCTQEPLHHTQLRRSMSHSEPDLQVSFLDTTECDDLEYINMPPKPLTSITYLQQPLPPSKLPTKHPKVPGRVLTSMENMESMEERERERKDNCCGSRRKSRDWRKGSKRSCKKGQEVIFVYLIVYHVVVTVLIVCVCVCVSVTALADAS